MGNAALSKTCDPAPATLLAEFAQRQLKRLTRAWSAARQTGAAADVHALRVAARRLNEPLHLMEESLGAKRSRRGRKALRTARRAFSHVRDLDVLADTFREHEASGLIRADQRAGLVPILEAWREAAWRRAQKACTSGGVAQCVSYTEAAIKQFSRSRKRCRTKAVEILDDHFDDRVAALKAGAIGAGADLHPARIAVKKLRYCAELRQQLGVADHAALIAQLTDAQTLLGHWNDQLTAATWLTALASNREMMASMTNLCADLLEIAARVMRVAEADRDRIETTWPRVLASLDRPKSDPLPARMAARLSVESESLRQESPAANN